MKSESVVTQLCLILCSLWTVIQIQVGEEMVTSERSFRVNSSTPGQNPPLLKAAPKVNS